MPNGKTKLEDHEMTSTPPEGCDLVVGDMVSFKNEYGVVFGPHRVMGFTLSENELHGRTVYINTDCFWMPKHPESLTKQKVISTPIMREELGV